MKLYKGGNNQPQGSESCHGERFLGWCFISGIPRVTLLYQDLKWLPKGFSLTVINQRKPMQILKRVCKLSNMHKILMIHQLLQSGVRLKTAK